MAINSFPISTKTFSSIGAGSVEYLSNYASLAAAISSLGTKPCTLVINANADVSAPVTIPATTVIAQINEALLSKTSTGAITFEGMGVAAPESQVPLFSGFASGDITWTGTDYPSRISSSLWADTNWGARLSQATAAFTSQNVTILASPLGTPTAQVTIKSGQSVYFTRGTYENAIDAAPWVVLESDTCVYGDGIGQTIIKESSASGRVQGFYADGVITYPYDGFNKNIIVRDITFLGEPTQTVNSAMSAVFLGNCTNGIVRNCEFWGTHGFGCYVGAFATAGYHAQNCYIDHNIFRDLKTQNCGALSGKNIFITDNLFTEMNTDVSNPLLVAIDIEPNATGEYVENLQILNNIIDARGAVQSVSGIILQIGGSATNSQFCRIAGNIIVGQDPVLPETGTLVAGIVVAGSFSSVIENNIITGAGQQGLALYSLDECDVRDNTLLNCGGGGTSAVLVNGCTETRVRANRAAAQAGFAAVAYVDEVAPASNKYIYNEFSAINLGVGSTSAVAPIVYV